MSNATERDERGRLVRDALLGRYPGAEQDVDCLHWDNIDQGVRDQYTAGADAVAADVRAEYAGLVRAAERVASGHHNAGELGVAALKRELDALPSIAFSDRLDADDAPEGIRDNA